jgi:hypothetical protein
MYTEKVRSHENFKIVKFQGCVYGDTSYCMTANFMLSHLVNCGTVTS